MGEGSGGGALGSDAGNDLATGPTTVTRPATTTGPPTSPTTTGAVAAGTTTPPTGPARFVARGPATGSRVALTFHTDGDLGLAGQLLDVLAGLRTPMTAFVVGEWLAAHPDWATRLTTAGHELANHTYTHPSFGSLTPDAMRDEIVRTRDLLVQLTGAPGRWFRPSGTGDGTQTPSDAVLAAAGDAGYPVVLGFDVDPLDYQSPGAAAIVQRVLATATPGAIVSLHFGYPGTVAALPGIVGGLADRGLTPVTVATLLGT